MTRWCGAHGGLVPDGDAQIVNATETGSGPGLPAYACIGCIRSRGIVPPTVPTAARRCDRCERMVEAWTARPVDDDRGPLEVVWCTDPAACNDAREAAAGSRTRRALPST